MSAARNKARANCGSSTAHRGEKIPALVPAPHATTDKRLTDVESASPNLQRIAAPIANSNKPLSFLNPICVSLYKVRRGTHARNQDGSGIEFFCARLDHRFVHAQCRRRLFGKAKRANAARPALVLPHRPREQRPPMLVLASRERARPENVTANGAEFVQRNGTGDTGADTADRTRGRNAA